jgi:hypothetical protein
VVVVVVDGGRERFGGGFSGAFFWLLLGDWFPRLVVAGLCR